VCCSASQYVAVRCRVWHTGGLLCHLLPPVELQCVAECCCVLQCVAECCVVQFVVGIGTEEAYIAPFHRLVI